MSATHQKSWRAYKIYRLWVHLRQLYMNDDELLKSSFDYTYGYESLTFTIS